MSVPLVKVPRMTSITISTVDASGVTGSWGLKPKSVRLPMSKLVVQGMVGGSVLVSMVASSEIFTVQSNIDGLETCRKKKKKDYNVTTKILISGNAVAENNELRARRALMLFKHVSLRTRRALSIYKVHGNSALLGLNETSFNNVNAFLPLRVCWE